jgi:hypothetical protein
MSEAERAPPEAERSHGVARAHTTVQRCSPTGWIGDPVPFYDSKTDTFHIFSICNPSGNIAPWSPGGVQGYCHAITTDFVTYTTLPLALNASGGTGSVFQIRSNDTTVLPSDTYAVLFQGGGYLAVTSDANMTTW